MTNDEILSQYSIIEKDRAQLMEYSETVKRNEAKSIAYSASLNNGKLATQTRKKFKKPIKVRLKAFFSKVADILENPYN